MTRPAVTMQALLSLRRPTEAVVSPDGCHVACSVLNAACTDPPAGQQATAWAITQTDRFAAAMPMACVSDWLSFHHTTNIGRFDELFVGAGPYDAGGLYFQRSPIMHVRNVRTPTLIIHGALDLCTPVGQAEELYRGIADTGLAEVELVIYPREGHGITERAHQLDFWERARAFFDRHLGQVAEKT
jgi:dipeptidyl aminopeptidase/acylaminoacyl peptidase